MLDLEEAKRILGTLEREGVQYVLVGSMAMAAQGLIRATRDMDFFISPVAENVERLKRALKALYDGDPNVDQISAQDLAGDYPALEYVPPHGRYSMDILTRLGEMFRFETLESEEIVLDGIRIRVATPSMLYRMQKGTVRPQDRLDAEVIRQELGLPRKSDGCSQVPVGRGDARLSAAHATGSGEPAPGVRPRFVCAPFGAGAVPPRRAQVPDVGRSRVLARRNRPRGRAGSPRSLNLTKAASVADIIFVTHFW
jgi:hypothetical protein